ncbi:hypothetical protein LTR36_006297 [Oleoguttula mirabilis]|uniref:Uncharacterized protein n=1 Tax=Oleoguttula mirabilis TaxID=1507867 RepID=A0AAV9JCI1_9PEZI|nr:hypothetical protein LTR36_006297 [Oleoguttula mirabilis]
MFGVQIGVPFNAGSGCLYVLNELSTTLLEQSICISLEFTNWSCTDDGYGDTLLRLDVDHDRYNCENPNEFINIVLSIEYPMVNGFNCPM